MIMLDSGNVLLKPSHRRHILACLKRPHRMGARLGECRLNVSMSRVGRLFEVRADVRDAAGAFRCRSRQRDWRSAMRDIAWSISARLSQQRLFDAA